jgi:hypothetical protein
MPDRASFFAALAKWGLVLFGLSVLLVGIPVVLTQDEESEAFRWFMVIFGGGMAIAMVLLIVNLWIGDGGQSMRIPIRSPSEGLIVGGSITLILAGAALMGVALAMAALGLWGATIHDAGPRVGRLFFNSILFVGAGMVLFPFARGLRALSGVWGTRLGVLLMGGVGAYLVYLSVTLITRGT